MTPDQLAHRNARVAEGQRRAWQDPDIRERRSKAIAASKDCPLHRALMREKALKQKRDDRRFI